METHYDPVELNANDLGEQRFSTEPTSRSEWIEPRLERRGDLSSATGFFGGFSP